MAGEFSDSELYDDTVIAQLAEAMQEQADMCETVAQEWRRMPPDLITPAKFAKISVGNVRFIEQVERSLRRASQHLKGISNGRTNR